MSVSPVNIGFIGCGQISGPYLRMCKQFEVLQIAACADLMMERAEAQATQYEVPVACSPEELLADPAIQIVVNLTPPQAHYEVAMAAIEAGKSVWNEKPLALNRQEGQELLAAADEAGVLVGCAPDTFLGAGLQTSIKLIDDGEIGKPIGATAFMLSCGAEHFHPNPEFFYRTGGGPMFDMGPYYLTALIAMLGPVQRVTGSARISFPERTITSKPKQGTKITVEVPTHVAGIMDFASGAIGTIITSFDVWATQLPRIEIYGSEATLSVPDPNTVKGPVRVRRAGEDDWQQIELTHGYRDNARSIGVADMAYALQSGRPHRASGELAYHVLDIMCAIHEASDQGQHIKLTSTCSRPAPLPVGLPDGTLDK